VIVLGVYTIRKLNKKKIIIKPNPLEPKINIETKQGVQEIEYSDIKYYQDIEKEFNARQKLYDQTVNAIVQPVVEVRNEVVNLAIPENLINGIDQQNAHDQFVQKGIQTIYKDNCGKYIYGSDTALQEIMEYEPEVKDIIGKIQSRNAYISNLKSNEKDVLKNVWCHAAFTENENIKNNLIIQLKDCKNKTGIYCPTGVVSRVINSLVIEKPEESPRDKYTINNEILAKFSKLYKDAPDDIDKNQIKNAVLKDYKDPKMKHMVGNLIDEWIEHV